MTNDTDYITTKLKTWDDEEVLDNFFKFFPRVAQMTQLVENDEGVVVAQMLITVAGNKAAFSEPETLEWPLIKAPYPLGGLVVTKK
jgi:hypothetical protein